MEARVKGEETILDPLCIIYFSVNARYIEIEFEEVGKSRKVGDGVG